MAVIFRRKGAAPVELPVPAAPTPSIAHVALPIEPFTNRTSALQIPAGISAPVPEESIAAEARQESAQQSPIALPPTAEKMLGELKAHRTLPTQEQIFNILWPVSYRDYLAYIQDILIQSHFIPAETRTNFKTQDDIFGFLTKSVDLLAERGFISQYDAPRFKQGINGDLRIIKSQELNGLLTTGELPGIRISMSAPQKTHELSFGQVLWRMILGAFRPASAQDCAREVNPLNTIPGVNLWAPSCNGFAGKIPIGCLNAVCPFGNAIWDPVTGICGCDF